MVEKETNNDLSKHLKDMEDWYRAVIFDADLKVISTKNYEVKESELK